MIEPIDATVRHPWRRAAAASRRCSRSAAAACSRHASRRRPPPRRPRRRAIVAPLATHRFSFDPESTGVVGELQVTYVALRGHALRHRAALQPRLRGGGPRQPGRRPVAAGRGHAHRAADAVRAAGRAARGHRGQPRGAAPLLFPEAGQGRPRASCSPTRSASARSAGRRRQARPRSSRSARTRAGRRPRRCARSMRRRATRCRRACRPGPDNPLGNAR